MTSRSVEERIIPELDRRHSDGASGLSPSGVWKLTGRSSTPGKRRSSAKLAFSKTTRRRWFVSLCNSRSACRPTRPANRYRDSSGRVAGRMMRTQQAIDGAIHVALHPVVEGVYRVVVRVKNVTALGDAVLINRDDALMQSLVSAHLLLGVQGGEFVSLLDPPENLARDRERMPQRWSLPGPGGRGRTTRHDAVVSHHPVRLPADRS